MTEPRFLLDTNICIDLLGGRSASAAARVQQHSEGEIVTSAIVYAEVMIGARRRNAVEVAHAFFRAIPIMAFDLAAGDRYGTLSFKRGNFDRLIGAHALQLGLTLVTGNVRDFADIPGLEIEDWTR